MTKKTKAVLSSVAAIAMSATLVTGGTFALFTSESNVDITISSAKVSVKTKVKNLKTYSVVPATVGEVGAFEYNGTGADAAYSGTYKYVQQDSFGEITSETQAHFKNGGKFKIDNAGSVSMEKITPGDKVEFQIQVDNLSNVDAQIRTGIFCVAGPTLYQQLIIHVDGQRLTAFDSYSSWELVHPSENSYKVVNVVIEFPIGSGNEFQDLSTQIGYKVEAVQGNAAVQPWITSTSAFGNFNAQASGNVATNTVANEEGSGFTTVTSESKTVVDNTGSVSAVIPAGTETKSTNAVGESLTQVELTVQNTTENHNFTVSEGSNASYVDISMKELIIEDGNVTENLLDSFATPVIVTMNIGKGLYNVGLQHKKGEDYETFTNYQIVGESPTRDAISSAEGVDVHTEFYYNIVTGELTLASTSFSPFAITYDTVYNTSENSATIAQIIEKASAKSTIKVNGAKSGTEGLTIDKPLTLVIDGAMKNAITVAKDTTLRLSKGKNSSYAGTLTLGEGAKVISAFALPESVAASFACEENSDGTYTYSNPVCSMTNGDVTKFYATLKAAYNASADGSEIKLLSDCSFSSLSIGKKVTLNLNGHNINTTFSNYGLFIGSEVTITDTASVSGTINVPSNYGIVVSEGNVTLSNVTCRNNNGFVMLLQYSGSATFESGIYYGQIYQNEGCNVVINGGLFNVANDIKGYVARETEGGYFYKKSLMVNWQSRVTEETEYTTYDETAKTITISSAEQLALLAKEVNAGTPYQGWTITLSADIDLIGMVETETQVTGYEWTPIGNDSKSFQGHFDGGNHTIKNLCVLGKGELNRGFFGFTQSGSVKNMVFENAYVEGYLNVGVVAGTPYTSTYENITVKGDIIVDGYAYVGGMFGKNLYANATNLTINANAGSYVKADSEDYRTYVGGIVGFMGEGNITVSNVVSNIDVYGSTCDVGGITGIAHYNNKFINVTCTANVYITRYSDEGDQLEMGGIAGVWHNQGGTSVTLKDCSFTGNLTATNASGRQYTGPWNKNGLVGRQYSAGGTGTLILENCSVNSTPIENTTNEE